MYLIFFVNPLNGQRTGLLNRTGIKNTGARLMVNGEFKTNPCGWQKIKQS